MGKEIENNSGTISMQLDMHRHRGKEGGQKEKWEGKLQLLVGLHSAQEKKTLVKTEHGFKVKVGFALVKMEGRGWGSRGVWGCPSMRPAPEKHRV